MDDRRCEECGKRLVKTSLSATTTRCAECWLKSLGEPQPGWEQRREEAWRQEREEEAQARIRRRWDLICPRGYADTDPEHRNMPRELLAKLLRWEGYKLGRGLGLIGPSRRCKTRMMFLVLKQLHAAGELRVFATRATVFARACVDAFSRDESERDEARKLLQKAREVDILFFDDIGKERFTDRVESEFYDLLEERSSWKRPTMWTSNALGSELHQRMSEDRRTPIVGRLREFSDIVHVEGKGGEE